MKKKILTALLCVTMVCGLAACGVSAPQTPAASTPAQEGTTAATTESKEEAQEQAPAADAITLVMEIGRASCRERV